MIKAPAATSVNVKASNGDSVHVIESPISNQFQALTTATTLILGPGMTDPIEMTADGIEFNTDLMLAGEPYTLHLDGVPLIAVKNVDGTIDFFAIPTR